MSPQFVPLTAGRIPAAMELRASLYRHEEVACDADAGPLLAELIANPSLGALWFLEVEGQTAGYLLLTMCYSLEFHGRFALLDELYVEEAWRGQGIGAAALDFAGRESRARGLHAMRLEVTHANPRALDLYRRSGFVVDPRHLMTRWL